jgi:hypothetical protein
VERHHPDSLERLGLSRLDVGPDDGTGPRMQAEAPLRRE